MTLQVVTCLSSSSSEHSFNRKLKRTRRVECSLASSFRWILKKLRVLFIRFIFHLHTFRNYDAKNGLNLQCMSHWENQEVYPEFSSKYLHFKCCKIVRSLQHSSMWAIVILDMSIAARHLQIEDLIQGLKHTQLFRASNKTKDDKNQIQ